MRPEMSHSPALDGRSKPLATSQEVLLTPERQSFKSARFIATAPGKYEWQPEIMPTKPKSEEARVEVWFEYPSVGTFSAKDRGDDIKLRGGFDEDGLYREGEPSEQFPMSWGYAEAGKVISSRSPRVTEGSLVSGTMQFAKDYVGGAEKLYEVSPMVHEELTPLVKHVMPIVGGTILGAVDAVARIDNISETELQHTLSDQRIYISGAGPLGLICAKWLQQLGAEKVLIADIDPARVALAQAMGIEAVQAPNTRSLADKAEKDEVLYAYNKAVKKHFPEPGEEDPRHGTKNGPDMVIEFSGAADALKNAFEISRNYGKIINAGYNPNEVSLDLGKRAHHFGISLIPAQVGYLPDHQKKQLPDKPGWNRDRLSQLGETFLLAQDPTHNGQQIQDTLSDHLITHVIPFTKAPETYHAVMQNNKQGFDTLEPYKRHPDIATMGYTVYYSDAVPQEVMDRLVPQSEKEKEKVVRLEMGGGYGAEVSEGKLTVRNEKGEVMIADAVGMVELSDGRMISTKDATIKKEGNTVNLEVTGVLGQPDLKVAITADQDRPALRITQEITNTTEQEINLSRFVQLDMQEGLSGVKTDEEVASAIGYMSWAAPIHRKVSLLDVQPDFRYIPQVTPLMEGGQVISEAVHIQADHSDRRVLIGHLPSEKKSRHQGVVEMHNSDARITAWNDAEDMSVAPGKKRKSEELFMLFNTNRNTGLETHAKELAKKIGFVKKPNKEPYVGICTWSWAFGKLQPSDVRGAMDKIASLEEKGVRVNLMQIDDLGAERHPHGDWVGELDKFLKGEFGGLKGFADEVHAQGKDAGVWMAPGFVNEQSPLHKKILEKGGAWYVKREDGLPIVEKHMWEGKIQNQYILDMTHPEVKEHMREQLQGLVDAGVDYIKLDFLYNLMLPGQRYQNDLTSVEAYNEFFNLFDEVWGERKVNACGAPFYKTAGRWAIRGGADVLADNAPQWYSPGGKDKLSGGAAQNSVLANFMRLGVLSEINQHIDPDSTTTRLIGDSKFTPAEVRTVAASARMGSDALITIGDDPRSIEDDQITLLKLAISTGEAARPIAYENGFPTIAMRRTEEGHVELFVLNWREFEEQDYVISPDLLGLDMHAKGLQVTDIFTGAESFHPGEVHVRNIAPHGVGAYTIKSL